MTSLATRLDRLPRPWDREVYLPLFIPPVVVPVLIVVMVLLLGALRL
jgi:hypothetical protein